MLANGMAARIGESRGAGASILGVIGDLFNRAETVDFTEKTGAFESQAKARQSRNLEPVSLVRQVSVARSGCEIYTRTARTGYIHGSALGTRINTRG